MDDVPLSNVSKEFQTLVSDVKQSLGKSIKDGLSWKTVIVELKKQKKHNLINRLRRARTSLVRLLLSSCNHHYHTSCEKTGSNTMTSDVDMTIHASSFNHAKETYVFLVDIVTHCFAKTSLTFQEASTFLDLTIYYTSYLIHVKTHVCHYWLSKDVCLYLSSQHNVTQTVFALREFGLKRLKYHIFGASIQSFIDAHSKNLKSYIHHGNLQQPQHLTDKKDLDNYINMVSAMCVDQRDSYWTQGSYLMWVFCKNKKMRQNVPRHLILDSIVEQLVMSMKYIKKYDNGVNIVQRLSAMKYLVRASESLSILKITIPEMSAIPYKSYRTFVSRCKVKELCKIESWDIPTKRMLLKCIVACFEHRYAK